MFPSHKSVSTWVVLLIVVAAIATFHLRAKWLPRLRAWRASSRIRLEGYNIVPSFAADVEAGLSSANFDVLNINANDSRKGLDDAARKQILLIMEQKGVSFDEARLEYTKRTFKENQIGPDGMPLDPKAVTFGK